MYVSALRRPGRLLLVCLFLAILVAFTSLVRAGQPPKPEDLKFPEGLKVLTQQQYQELLDKIARLEAQLKLDKPVAPSSCHLTGRLDGDVLRLKARFGFETFRPHALIALGCRQGNPTTASIDGKLPLLQWGEEGWHVQVEKADKHELTIDFDVSLLARADGRGFELNLPGASFTTLELELPEEIKTVRLDNQNVATTPAEAGSRVKRMALGASVRLDVAWAGPRGAAAPAPLLAADGRFFVKVAEASLTLRAELTLRALSGRVEQFTLSVPTQAEVKQPATEDPQTSRILAIETPDVRRPQFRLVRLKEPTADPVRVEVTTTLPRQGNVSPWLAVVRPIALVGATRQRGVLLISKPADLQLRFSPRGEPEALLNPRDPTEEERTRDPSLSAVFAYWNMPTPAVGAALLEMEVEKLQGLPEARVIHTLTLGRNGPDEVLLWRDRVQIDVTPPRGRDLDAFSIELPAEFQYDRGIGVLTTSGTLDVQQTETPRRTLRVLFERTGKPFTLTLEGVYPALDKAVSEASLKLPKPLGAWDRGGEIRLAVPREFKLAPARPDDPLWDESTQGAGPHERTAVFSRRLPDQIEVLWRPHRPELTVQSKVELSITGRQVEVVQTLVFQAGPELSETALLVPEGLQNVLQVVAGGELVADDRPAGAKSWRVRFAEPGERRVQLRYFFTLPAAEPGEPEGGRSVTRFSVPLVRPESATRLETTVLALVRPGSLLASATDSWEVRPLRVEPGRERLPALVLAGSGAETPLTLRFSEPAAMAVTPVVVERALIRIATGEGTPAQVHASFLLGQLLAPYVDLELPVPALESQLRLALRLGQEGRAEGRNGLGWVALDERGQPAANGRIVRVALPADLLQKPAVLEVLYQLPAVASSPWRGWPVTLEAPRIRGAAGPVPVRWLVSLPTGSVPLATQGGVSQSWGWRGWLVGPKSSASSADLESWFYPEGQRPPAAEGAFAEPALVLATLSAEPVRVRSVPQQFWLLGCSVVVLVVGLGLYLLANRRFGFWVLALGLGVAVLVLGLFWPPLLAAVAYGCEPGAVVLVVILTAQVLLHQRYRRQVVFMPGFKRAKAGSSLLRSGSGMRPRTEPTTVDAPPAAPGSGQWAQG